MSIELAVAGAGAWGRNHVRDLASMRGVHLRWVVEPDPERREAAAALAPGVRTTADVEEALSDRAVEALVVASPTPTHVPLARAALAHGRHVLVEKPLAERSRDAWDLVKRAERAGCHLVVGHILLYHPAIERLHRLMAQGHLGRPFYLAAQRTNRGRIRTDEGTLWSLAPHDVSVMVHLLGTWPIAVSAQGAVCVQPAAEDVVFLTLEFPDGVLGHIHLSWLDPRKTRRLAVVGSRRMAVFDDMEPESPLRLHELPAVDPSGAQPPPVHRTRVVPTPTGAPLRRELQAFVRGLRAGRASRTPGADGARVVQVLEAAQRSLEAGGRRVPIRVREARSVRLG